MKWLLWIVVVFAILLGLRLYSTSKAKRRRDAMRASQRDAAPTDIMIRCVRCGTYVPRAEARPGPKGMTCSDPKCAKRG
jgi:hypothetical protein